MEATRKEHIMARSPHRILRIGLASAAALVLVAPPGSGAAATVAKGRPDTTLAQYVWGGASTHAKKKTRAAIAAGVDDGRLLARYGWGAAATYAKLHA
jgi:hypothetical protein